MIIQRISRRCCNCPPVKHSELPDEPSGQPTKPDMIVIKRTKITQKGTGIEPFLSLDVPSLGELDFVFSMMFRKSQPPSV